MDDAWMILGASWASCWPPVAYWKPPGPSWMLPGASWGPPGASWGASWRLGSVNTQNRSALRALAECHRLSPLAQMQIDVTAFMLLFSILLIIYNEQVRNLDEFTSIRTSSL